MRRNEDTKKKLRSKGVKILTTPLFAWTMELRLVIAASSNTLGKITS